MKKYYLSLHSKKGKEYEDARTLKKMFYEHGIERTNNPYEADVIVAFFYGKSKLDMKDHACEVKVLELIHEKNLEAQIFVWGPVTEVVNFPSLYPFLCDPTAGKTWADFAREGWGKFSPEVYEGFREQITEDLLKTEIPRLLSLPESADALEETICNWVIIDEVVGEMGRRPKNAKGFDEELSFSLPIFVNILMQQMMRAYKGELKPITGLSTEKVEKLAKAYFEK